MGNISNKLCNPTEHDVKWDYHAGIKLVIPGDGSLDLPAEVMDDFRDGKAGTPAVKELMDYLGIFLRDPDRPYEVQALEAIEASIKQKEVQLTEFSGNLRRRSAGMGNIDEAAIEETKAQQGYVEFEKKLNALKERRDFLRSVLKDEDMRKKKEEFDLSRTLMFHTPPKVFETPLALEMYLMQHPEDREKHEAFLAAQTRGDSSE